MIDLRDYESAYDELRRCDHCDARAPTTRICDWCRAQCCGGCIEFIGGLWLCDDCTETVAEL